MNKEYQKNWLTQSEIPNNKMVHTGWWPPHWIWLKGYRMGGGSRQAGGGRPQEGRRGEFSCNDRDRCRGSREAMDRTIEEESAPGCRVYRRQGGAGGYIVTGSNKQCSRHRSKENQDMRQYRVVPECQHWRMNRGVLKRENEETELS